MSLSSYTLRSTTEGETSPTEQLGTQRRRECDFSFSRLFLGKVGCSSLENPFVEAKSTGVRQNSTFNRHRARQCERCSGRGRRITCDLSRIDDDETATVPLRVGRSRSSTLRPGYSSSTFRAETFCDELRRLSICCSQFAIAAQSLQLTRGHPDIDTSTADGLC